MIVVQLMMVMILRLMIIAVCSIGVYLVLSIRLIGEVCQTRHTRVVVVGQVRRGNWRLVHARVGLKAKIAIHVLRLIRH